MGTLADSLFNLLMGWVRALVNAIWALFTTDHTTLLEFLGKNWVLIVVVILAAGLAIDWLVWLIRWQPYHLWARRARRFLRMPEPEQEEKRKKRAPSGDETQKMPAAYAQTDSGAPEEEEEEQWLPLQQPQMDERQAQEVMQRAQSVPDEELGAYPGMRYGAKAAEGMAETQRYSAVRAEGPGAAEVERRRAEIDAWQQQMQEEARQKAEAERQRIAQQKAYEAERQRIAQQKAYEAEQQRIAQQKAYEAEQQRIAQQKAYEAEQQRIAQQKAYEAEQQRVAQQKAYEEAQRQKAQAEYQRQLAEYERQKAQYEQDMARYRQEKAAYDAEMARRAAQSDEAAQTDAQTAPRRRRAPQQKPRTYSDYVSGETVERLPDPPQWPQVQQAAEAAKKPKKGLVSRVAKMMEEDDGNEIAGINALPPRVSKDEAYHPAKTPQKNGKRKR